MAKIKTPIPTVLIRSTNAGVFVGALISHENGTVVLNDARRLWYWAGASSLSELATKGVSRPQECKFPCTVPRITVLGVCEIIPMTTAAIASVAAVPVWTQHA
jgi:hypothetical protein